MFGWGGGVLFSCRAGDSDRTEGEGSQTCGGGARDALADGDCVCRAADQRVGDYDFASPVLSGRGGQREHEAAVHAAASGVAGHGSDGVSHRDAGL